MEKSEKLYNIITIPFVFYDSLRNIAALSLIYSMAIKKWTLIYSFIQLPKPM